MDKTNPNNLYFTNNDNLLVLNKTDEYLKKLTNQNSFTYNFFDFIKSNIIIIIIIFIILLLVILYQYNKYHKEDFDKINNINNNPSTFFSDTKDAEEDMGNNFNRPTFNPLHSINDNQNYNHFLPNDPLFNGVYNNNISDRNYKPMDMLTNDTMLDNYQYINSNPIINTQPTYYNANSLLPVSDKNYKDYRKINEENINGKITMTFKPIN